MISTDKPLVYFILGAAGSGRRSVLLDLIADGLPKTDQPAVLLCENEASTPVDEKLPAVTRWAWTGSAIEAEFPAAATHVFLISDGRGSPVDQIEALKPWIDQNGAEMGRVITVVNCQLGEVHPPLLAWYDACVHFSDVVLLNLREGVLNKWISDFQGRYKDQFFPCLIEFVKAGRVKSASVVLDPVALRISHYFEEEQEWIITGGVDESEAEGDEEIQAAPEEDPYLTRHTGGRRVKEIPGIADYLPATK